MLDIKTVELQNFLSYGEPPTILDLSNIGPTLILGDIPNESGKNKNNGSGKSSLIESVVWCLFGRTNFKQRPGDSIINWTNEKNCYVKIETKDGYKVIRTRNMAGHSDLRFIEPDGTETSSSTTTDAGKKLLKLFNLDFNIFSSSVFFGQFGKPFLELTDPNRRAALEKMLHIAYLDKYAEVAKNKYEASEREQFELKSKFEELGRDIEKINLQVEKYRQEESSFEGKRQNKINSERQEMDETRKIYTQKIDDCNTKIKSLNDELVNFKGIDIKSLKDVVSRIEEVEELKKTYFRKVEEYNVKIRTLSESKITDINEVKKTHARKIAECNSKIEALNKELTDSKEINIESLRTKWDVVAKIEEAIKNKESGKVNVDVEIITLEKEISRLRKDISEWEGKSGKICPECKQEITSEHTSHTIDPIKFDLASNIEKLKERRESSASIKTSIESIRDKLNSAKPSHTIKDAESINNEKVRVLSRINELKESVSSSEKNLSSDIQKIEERVESRTIELRELIASAEEELISSIQKIGERISSKINELKESIASSEMELASDIQKIEERINKIRNEENPYKSMILGAGKDVEKINSDISEHQKKISQYDALLNHIDYIKSAYSDRKKIRSFILSTLIPYFNDRIAYYLNAFGYDFELEFNSYLQVKTNRWSYEMYSGGERKRIDLAMMFALYDLYTAIYGKQCNLLVFDEVDGRLDEEGIYKFVEVLNTNFISKDKTSPILIISHRNEMKDSFPSQIKITKINNFSHIEEIRS